MEQALARCLGGGGEGGGFARCLPPAYGYLRVRITRCANLLPVGDDTYGDAPSVCCACWLAGSPEVQQTTPREKRDVIGSVLWTSAEDLWLPLHMWPVTLVVELRLGIEHIAEGAKRTSSLACGVAYCELVEVSEHAVPTWLRVEGTGPPRSDGERLGSAELQLSYSAHVQRGSSAVAMAQTPRTRTGTRTAHSPHKPTASLLTRGATLAVSVCLNIS